MTRLVIVDDDLVQLERLKIILAGEKDISIAGVYSDPREALRNLVTDRPNIILTDICMPLIDGAAFISQSRKILPKADFIALTCMDDDETIDKVFSSGASGYLLKSESPARLCEVLRKYHKGEPPLSSKVVSHLVERMREKNGSGGAVLTDRERRILLDAREGYTYKETAGSLGVSVHTVHNQVQKLFEKLGVNSKAEALRAASRKGYI